MDTEVSEACILNSNAVLYLYCYDISVKIHMRLSVFSIKNFTVWHILQELSRLLVTASFYRAFVITNLYVQNTLLIHCNYE